MFKRMFRYYDYSIIIAILCLCAIGLVMIYSASMVTSVTRYDVPYDYFYNRQKAWLVVAFLFFFLTMILPYRIYLKIIPYGIVTIVAALIFLFVLGHTAGNAKSWFQLGPANLQPAEFAKLGITMYLAMVLSKRQEYINNFRQAFLGPIGLTLFILGLVLAQPDFGTAMLIGVIAAAVMSCSGINLKSFFKLVRFGLALVLVGLPIGKLTGYVSEERLSRFTGASDPFKHAEDAGYQLVNSYLAIGSGGVKGLGLGESIQKYGYLPESHTDFIMAVIAEELGFFGVAVVLLLLFFIVAKTLLLAKKCDDPFGSLICVGIGTMIGIQAFVNLGGLTGLIPITGVPLPFISYGGSSLVLLMISMGMVVNISMFVNYRKDKKQTNSQQQKLTATKGNSVPLNPNV
ncbi:FtsW/RodA/SpoVE family cell cycle protein [Bacillus songklensis]|uniref:Probable peptidoglycan glycosyltransferase FtsW n=1 Tax=Bacillus songklensis TaxID=1069116 RepID=A0ABV8B1Z6_9BACI